MSSRNSERIVRVLVLSLWVAAAVFAQPQPPTVATGNASVSGVVTNSATGGPLPRAHVTVIILGNTGAQNFNATTNDEGKFSIGGLPPGRFLLNVDHVGFVPPGNRMSDSPLRPDEKRDDLRLALTPTGSISGHVLNAGGTAVQ